MNKKLRFAFLVSLLVNVLLVGILLGALSHRVESSLSRQQQMEKALKELPEPIQGQFREKLARMRKDGEPLRDQIQDARDGAIRALVADPFAEAAYDSQVNKLNELRVQLIKQMAEDVKEIAKESPLEERQMLAAILNQPPTAR